jgi:probable rRNA maturation factor
MIDNRQRSCAVDPAELERRVRMVLEDLGCAEQTELSLVVTDDPYIAQLNEHYLGRKGPTNVLAFPMAEGELDWLTPGLLGDVVVSVDTAWREAEENGLEPLEHFYRLVIHGILHLLGYDHLANEEQAQLIEALTERLLIASAG